MIQKRRPHLRVVLTPHCNFRCRHCRPGGEGYYENINDVLSKKELIDIISLCGDVGFRDIKLTGGEPLIRKDLEDVISEIKGLNKFNSLGLVTNGSLLYGRSKDLKEAGLNFITISLDATDRNVFLKITNTDCFLNVMEGIKEAINSGLKTRINCVLGKSNRDQLEGLIKIAKEVGAELKIIDVMDVNPEGNNWSDYSWKDEYLNLDYVVDRLKDRIVSKTISYPPGGLGTPMPTLILKNGVKILLRDATVGTNYDAATCGVCKYYPCQDALISLRITHNGLLKRCLIRNDNLVDVITPLRKGDKEEATNRIKYCFDILMRADYKANEWKFKK